VLTKDNYPQPVSAPLTATQFQVGTEQTDHPVGEVVVISVIIPTYNAADCLKPLYDRLSRVLLQITDKFELLFIEDCSKDHSWDTLVQMSKRLPYIRAVKLSRNFGQQAAITAGLSICKGEWAVVMDCDLQDPPEEIMKMWSKAKEGYDLVLARRIERKQSVLRRTFGKIYFGLLSVFSMSRIDGDFSSFTLVSRKVVDAFLSFSDRNRHYMMIIQWLGFERAIIDYQQGERFAGESSYSFRTLLKLAAQGFLFQTTVLLQLIIALGFLVSLVGVVLFAWTLWNYAAHANVLPGWTSVIDTLLILGGLILISIGVLGLYVGEIFDQVKQRPLFLLSKEVASGSDSS
jgi:glycosyltransferase involved in cell wall biosynthesis